jgi:hypothetical protein
MKRSLASTINLLCAVALSVDVRAASFAILRPKTLNQRMTQLTQRRRFRILAAISGGDEDESSIEAFADDEEQIRFLRDLQIAKTKKLGQFIPTEYVRDSALAAEAEFLRAMAEVSQNFERNKLTYGSDAALDIIMNQIRDDTEGDKPGCRSEQLDDTGDAFQ